LASLVDRERRPSHQGEGPGRDRELAPRRVKRTGVRRHLESGWSLEDPWMGIQTSALRPKETKTAGVPPRFESAGPGPPGRAFDSYRLRHFFSRRSHLEPAPSSSNRQDTRLLIGISVGSTPIEGTRSIRLCRSRVDDPALNRRMRVRLSPEAPRFKPRRWNEKSHLTQKAARTRGGATPPGAFLHPLPCTVPQVR
jgi:hypothetical protein